MKTIIFDMEGSLVTIADNTTNDVCLKPYDGILNILTKLKNMSVKIVAISNKPQKLAEKIAVQFFENYIDAIYGNNEDVKLKSQQLLKIAEDFDSKKEECLYIVDNGTDIDIAKEAGIFSIGILWQLEKWNELSNSDLPTANLEDIVKAASVETVKNYSQAGYIPYYWNKHIEEKIQKIHQNQIKAGSAGFSFGLISDIHWSEKRIKYSAAILEKVANECDIPYVFNGGDTVSGAGICGPDLLFSQLAGYSNDFKNLEPKMLMAQGNHDPAYCEDISIGYYNQNLTKAELYKYIFEYETKYSDRVMSKNGSYFYADITNQKFRLIVMNPYDVPNDDKDEKGIAKYNKMRLTGYRQSQLDWFVNEALNVPSTDWTVVLCTHINPASKEFCRNEDVILQIIYAFRKGTSYKADTHYEDFPDYNIDLDINFNGKGGEFAVWVSGHIHIDAETKEKDTLCTAIMSDWNHYEENFPYLRTSGTYFEHAFDIYTVDSLNHKIYVTRVGAGEDREYDYSPRS